MRTLASRLRSSAGKILRKVDGPIRRHYSRLDTKQTYSLEVSSPGGQFADQVAVVTGASGAIGRAIVLRLASEGAEVWALGRDSAKLDDLVAEAALLGGLVRARSLDFTDDVAVADFFEALDRVDILVTSAGGGAREMSRPIYQQSMEVIDPVLDTNLRGTILAVLHGSRRMLASGGRIVCLSSIIGIQGHAAYSDYAAAKAGIVGFVRSAAIDLGPHNIRINAVSPGKVPRGSISLNELERTERTNLLGRVCTHEDIADGVIFLVGPSGSFITGHDLVIDGGRSLGLRGDG